MVRPAGSTTETSPTVIINVEGDGECAFVRGGFQPVNFDWSKVIWNFPDADKLSFGSVSGSILHRTLTSRLRLVFWMVS